MVRLMVGVQIIYGLVFLSMASQHTKDSGIYFVGGILCIGIANIIFLQGVDK